MEKSCSIMSGRGRRKHCARRSRNWVWRASLGNRHRSDPLAQVGLGHFTTFLRGLFHLNYLNTGATIASEAGMPTAKSQTLSVGLHLAALAFLFLLTTHAVISPPVVPRERR